MGLPAQHWAKDPTGTHELRWWNGTAWTDAVKDGSKVGRAPMDGSTPSPGRWGRLSWKRQFLVLMAVVVAVFGLIVASGITDPGSSNVGMDSYCRHAATLVERIRAISRGTMTPREAVDALARSERGITQAAELERDPVRQREMVAVAVATGRLKVAYSGYGPTGGVSAAIADLTAAVEALPSC